MVKLTNEHEIDLPIAVWALQDGYNSGAADAPEGELISVTTMMKPTRQLILQRKIDKSQETLDISELLASRMGHGLHDSIERAWTEGNWQHAMKRLGYKQSVINRVVINPDPTKLKDDAIPIYLEQRGFKIHRGLVITGQLDFAISGAYRDFKTTSTFSYTSDKKTKDFILQGSLYRWIMPEMVWRDKMRIEFLFTDWLRYRAKADPNYPQAKAAHREYELLSHEEVTDWVDNKMDEIITNRSLSQDKMVRCTDEELWANEDEYKYYANEETAKKGGRCTKNFKADLPAAELWKQSKGKGVVVTVPGEVKRCPWCPAFTICEQRKEYFNDDQKNIQHV